MNLREATADDFDSILSLLKDMHSEVGTWSLSEPKVRNQITDCLSNGVVFVVEIDGKILATMGLGIAPASWFTDDKMIGDYWNFVHPLARKTRAGKLLLNAARHLKEATKLPLQVGIYGTVDLDRKTKFFARQGLEPTGVWFLTR